jgi:alpha-beta hydrolase superfamily lysophospholipase
MIVRSLLRWLARSLLALLSALLLVGIAFYGHYLWSGPDLQPWHQVRLTAEFTAADYKRGDVTTLRQYLAREQQVLDQVSKKIYRPGGDPNWHLLNRYSAGSLSDPGVWDSNWNRTFVLEPPGPPVGGVLLLHGLTDSPYSLRSIGLALAARGLRVVGLRLPGHGTAPAGLVTFEVEDLEAATRLAMHDLRASLGGGQPLYIVGYSNGAALGVSYALDAREDAKLPRPAGLVLISPAIGITRLAAIGRIRTGLSDLQGFGRAAWQVVEAEVDPYKYQSFSFHAAGQTQRLTSRLTRRIDRLARQGPLDDVPPILAFVSTVDSTVRAGAVVDALLGRLAPGGHELVLFDVNRLSAVQKMLVADPAPLTRRLLAQAHRPFALALVTNGADTLQVKEQRVAAQETQASERLLGLAWPKNVFSLSHVALPFPPDDPLYGYEAAASTTHVQLGSIEIRGENGVLNVPGWMLTRQRSNPFHRYLLERIEDFVLPTEATAGQLQAVQSAP